MNPNIRTLEELSDILSAIEIKPKKVFFYGAGCGSKAGKQKVTDTLQKRFPEAEIWVETDLLGAARAVAGNQAGIIVLLGTGSHSGSYDGRRVMQETVNLGYVLGDEASGADLGKELLIAYFYDELPGELKRSFKEQFGELTREDFIQHVYQKPAASRWLAGFARFVVENQTHPFLAPLIQRRINLFFERHLLPFGKALPIYVVGGLGEQLKPFLQAEAQKHSLEVGGFLPKPITGLIQYHAHY